MRLSKVALSLALLSGIASAAPTIPIDDTCASNGNAVSLRRAVPIIEGVQSCAGHTGDAVIKVLTANGVLWMKALDEWKKSPPNAPADSAKFSSFYTVGKEDGKNGVKLSTIEKTITDDIAQKILSSDTMKFTGYELKTPGGKIPYRLAISADGETLINTDSWTMNNDGGKAPMAFEDIMTYILAYHSDSANFEAHKANIPAAIKKVKRIIRGNIANTATMTMISKVMTDKNVKLAQQSQLLEVDPKDTHFAALLATNNGNLGPKLIGTNMKSLHSGAITKLYITRRPHTMVIELAMS